MTRQDSIAGGIAIAADDVVKTFGTGEARVTALDHVSIDIRQNEFFTLLGPSGCGKTTLLRLIAGFELPDAGIIRLDGEDITALPPHRRPVNTVFQNYALFPHMTVAENVAFGLRMQGRAKDETEESVRRILGMVRLERMADRRPEQLSGGQQQRVALARALAPAPRVLLLDEPLAALDLKLRKEMQVELKRLQHETGITFVFVTHDQEEALTMSDRIAVMRDGEILQVGDPQAIYDRPEHRFVADFIGDINILKAKADATDEGVRLTLGDGSELLAAPPADPPRGEVFVAIRPEAARLAEDGLPGTVERVIYFGAASNVHLRLGSGEPFTLRISGRRPPEIGARVHVAVAPENARILAD